MLPLSAVLFIANVVFASYLTFFQTPPTIDREANSISIVSADQVSPVKSEATTPTATPTPTPITKPTPVQTPKPTIIPTSTPAPTTQPKPVEITDVKSYLINAVNNYRASQGLSTVKTDINTCNFAKTRAGEIVSSFNHDGFNNRMSGGGLPYPSFSEVVENIAMNSNYKDVVNQWINSSGHAANMRKNTPFVCIESNGIFYVYEGWRP